MTTMTDTRPVSQPQAKYLDDLRSEYTRLVVTIRAAGVEPLRFSRMPIPTNCTEARASITAAKDMVSQLRTQARNLPAQPTATVQRIVVIEGLYIIGDAETDGTVFKVQHAVHGSGRLYAKRLTSDGVFVHAPGAIRDLATQGRKLSLEEAKSYGKLYGTCIRCGRTLTDETSIAAGIGPICAEKF